MVLVLEQSCCLCELTCSNTYSKRIDVKVGDGDDVGATARLVPV